MVKVCDCPISQRHHNANRVALRAAAWLALLAALPVMAATATKTSLTITSEDGIPAASVPYRTVVTLTAKVLAGATPVKSGTVNFCGATAKYCTDIHLIGTAQLTPMGIASIRLLPAIGTHDYKAVFAGTKSDAESTSAVAGLTVTGGYPTTVSTAVTGDASNYALRTTVVGTSASAPTGVVAYFDTTNENALLGTAELVPGKTPKMQSVSFAKSAALAAGSPTNALAVADFNGDGFPDIAVATLAGTLVVELGNGDGTFTSLSAVPESLLNTPSAIAVGDFNGDGIPDLAVANLEGGTVTILLGNGDGTFKAQLNPPTVGIQPSGIVADDFNHDGNLDLAVTNYSSGTVTILLGDGTGAFKATSASPATGSLPMAVAAGDFNSDGNIDLAVANSGSSSVTVLLGKGDGTFSPATESPSTGSLPYSIVAADFRGNGMLDLATVNYQAGTVTVLLGNGNGTFKAGAPVQVGGTPEFIAAGDFYGKGVVDLVTANFLGGNYSILKGSGTGTFVASSSKANGYPARIAVADFNGDGLDDLALENDGNVSLNVLLAQLSLQSTAFSEGITAIGQGTHQVETVYSGDAKNAPAFSTEFALNAEPLEPELTLAASPKTATPGVPVALTAMLSGNPLIVPTGSVVFYLGQIPLGLKKISAAGTAELLTTALPIGTDNVVAYYSGDTNYSSAISGVVAVTLTTKVQPTLKVALSAKSVEAGKPVTISTTVAGKTASPTGKMAFYVDGTLLAVEALRDGAASYSTSRLKVGRHSIRADYLGDSRFDSADSPSLTLMVVTQNTTLNTASTTK